MRLGVMGEVERYRMRLGVMGEVGSYGRGWELWE